MRRTVGLWWVVLTAVGIAVYAPLPYLTDTLRHLARSDVGIAATYVDQPGWAQAALYVHICFGGLALLVSPTQFVVRLRTRFPGFHRLCGRVVIVAMIVAGVAGLVMAPANMAGPVGTAGFGTLAVLWTTFAVAAYRAIRRGDVAAHRRWATRAFALTYAAVMLRAWPLVLVPLQTAFGVDEVTAFDRSYLADSFLSWVPNLLFAEVLLRRSRGRRAVPQGAGSSRASLRMTASASSAAETTLSRSTLSGTSESRW
ncbi:DUF2306 domain-containing protein [Streptosporangium sp. NPDC020145]|uniref:DUF2306 domain-containing protein n=1 Tax=Streptosporangium sp. NPDC020145 TaxID=3154694 RepID=UPI003418DE2F